MKLRCKGRRPQEWKGSGRRSSSDRAHTEHPSSFSRSANPGGCCAGDMSRMRVVCKDNRVQGGSPTLDPRNERGGGTEESRERRWAKVDNVGEVDSTRAYRSPALIIASHLSTFSQFSVLSLLITSNLLFSSSFDSNYQYTT